MKRINALSGMKWRVLLLVFLAGYTADVAIADHEIDESNFLYAASDGPESVRVERVLTADQIDSSTVDVGALAVVIYEQAARHPISGMWTQLDTVRASIKAVDSRRLIAGLEPDGWSKWIALERIQTLSLIGSPFSSSADRDHTRTRITKRVQLAQTAPDDSLMVKEISPPFDIENEALRFLAKAAAGTASSVVFTAIAFGGLGEVLIDDSYSDDGLEAVGLLFVSSYVGTMVGFPLGVSTVDPHDSLGKTLLGSGVAGLGGLGLIAIAVIARSEALAHLGVTVSFAAPPIVSIAMSEASRKPPQARRVSFGVAPTLNGGLSAFATLRF